MFDTVKKLSLAATVSLVALTGTAYAQEALRVSTVDVMASNAAATDSNAMEYFPQIADDVRAAIAERVPASNDASDPTISVDIRKIALDGSTMLPSAEFNELEGVVSIASQNGTLGDRAFPVNIKAVAGDATAPEGYVMVPPSEGEFYTVMVAFFADQVAAGLADVFPAGDEVSK
jgi:hypothetical protein